MSSSSSTDASSSAPKLQTVNYVNVAAYLSNFLVVFGSTQAGLPDNAALSDKYQTLVTPAAYAFAIWGIIFPAELIWTILQLLPAYRSHELVIKSVGYNFALACLCQAAWTVAFGLEKMVLALLCMVGILIPLVKILIETSATSSSSEHYWKLKFPLQLHAAWIMAATLVNLNVVAVAYDASSNVQTAVGWASLMILLVVGIYAVLKKEQYKRAWVVPSVLVWASLAISKELSNPRQQIVDTFSEPTIFHTKMAAAFCAYVLLVAMVIEVTRASFFCTKINSQAETQGQYSSLD